VKDSGEELPDTFIIKDNVRNYHVGYVIPQPPSSVRRNRKRGGVKTANNDDEEEEDPSIIEESIERIPVTSVHPNIEIIGQRTTSMAAKFRCLAPKADYYYDDKKGGEFALIQ
jgi:hypothetical protein